MKSISQLFIGLTAALTSGLLVLSAISLSILEGGLETAPQPSTATLLVRQVEPEISQPTPNMPSAIPMTSTSACPMPEGWTTYTITPGDTLQSIAQDWGAPFELLFEKNCLMSELLPAGYILYLPPQATPSVTFTLTFTIEPTSEDTATKEPPPIPSQVQCGPPYGWITYIVKPGDNLYRIGLAFGVGVLQLKLANCLTSDAIRAGQTLFVPNVSTRVPTATKIPTEEPPPPATETPQPTIEPTISPTEIPTYDVSTETIPTESILNAIRNP
jgi:LysM repeat protein